jgi:hypothetical protein
VIREGYAQAYHHSRQRTAELPNWLHRYNWHRPHGSIGHLPPISRQMLSEKRADSVMQYLNSQGAKEDMISAKGYGEQDPVASNDTAQGRAQNRRVELTLGRRQIYGMVAKEETDEPWWASPHDQ